MGIYVYKNQQKLGPYTRDEITTALQEGRFDPSDTAWVSGLSDWTDLGGVMAASPTRCPQCQGLLSLQTEYPQRSAGIIVIVLGIILAPVCIGVFLIFWGVMLAFTGKSQWHCRGCGRLFPA